MSKFDEGLNELRDLGVPEDVISKIEDASDLRKELKTAHAELQTAREAQQELARLRKQPKVAEALSEFGVDMQALNKRDRTIVENHFPDFDDAPERQAVATFLQEWGFESAAPEPEADESAGQGIVNAAVATNGGHVSTEITPKTYVSWDIGKRRAFQKQYPRETDQLKRGEVVRGVSF